MDPKKIAGGIGRFFRDIIAELKRVAWPSRRQLWLYTVVVIGSVFVIAALLSVFDFILSGTIVRLFGR